MKNIFLAMIALGIVLIGAYAFSMRASDRPAPAAEIAPARSASSTPYVAADFSWNVTPAPSYEETMPHQILTLVARDRSYEIGEYMGCTGVSDTASLEPDELVRTTCWFAGAGDHISVFKEGGKYVVKTRWIQETGGPDVQAPPEGEFAIVFTLE